MTVLPTVTSCPKLWNLPGTLSSYVVILPGFFEPFRLSGVIHFLSTWDVPSVTESLPRHDLTQMTPYNLLDSRPKESSRVPCEVPHPPVVVMVLSLTSDKRDLTPTTILYDNVLIEGPSSPPLPDDLTVSDKLGIGSLRSSHTRDMTCRSSLSVGL